MTTFTEAMATNLDPGEMFPLRDGEWIPRGAVLAILAMLDREGRIDADPAPGGMEAAANVLADLDPVAVERHLLDSVPVGSGKGAMTAATIRYCIDRILEVERGRP